jgi:hypothetical protein
MYWIYDVIEIVRRQIITKSFGNISFSEKEEP